MFHPQKPARKLSTATPASLTFPRNGAISRAAISNPAWPFRITLARFASSPTCLATPRRSPRSKFVAPRQKQTSPPLFIAPHPALDFGGSRISEHAETLRQHSRAAMIPFTFSVHFPSRGDTMRQPTSVFRSLLVAVLLALPAIASATEKIELNGAWLFRTDPKSEGESRAWFKTTPTGTESVRVPHTCNIGKYDDYEGTAWYFRTFDLPALTPQKHVELHFAATFYLS